MFVSQSCIFFSTPDIFGFVIKLGMLMYYSKKQN